MVEHKNLNRRRFIGASSAALGFGSTILLRDSAAAAPQDGLISDAGDFRARANAFRGGYQQQANALRERYATYAAKIREDWGGDAALPNGVTLVEYDDENASRRVVDYEEGRAEASVLVEPGEDPNSADVRERLAAEIEGMLTEGPDQRDLAQLAEEPGEPNRSGEPILNDQVDLEGRSPESFAQVIAAKPPSLSPVAGADGVERQVVTVNFSLLPDHVERRAKQFAPLVETHTETFGVQTPVVWSVMETESAFRPRAKSHIPAFGLMQLVPWSGGRDAYRYVYKEDRVVSEEFLYQPNENVELGTAYLRLVYDNYLKWISDSKTRLWASIASYNTGSGNVRKAFGRSQTEAARAINAMSPDEAFEHMRLNLPYAETRSYIVKVRDKSEKYGSIV
ncbi:MAG: transglycosylase SLT domain-containing protein [Pseudomonadota bacterium]